MMTNTPQNLYWINATKAICILFVYFQHAITLYNIKTGGYNPNYIASFYVNAFFFISGYLFFWKRLNDSDIKKGGAKALQNIFFKIVVPSIVFSLVEFFPKKLIKGGGITVCDFLYETLGGGTFWFTSALVVAELILIILLMISRIRNFWFYFVCCMTLSLIGACDEITSKFLLGGRYWWAWGSGLTALAFLAMGGLYWKFESKIKVNGWIVAFLIVLWIISISQWGDYLEFTPYNRKLNIAGVLVGALASLLLVFICKRSSPIGILDYIGRNSIGFYFLSGGVPMVYCLLFKLFGTPSVWGLFLIIILSITTSFLIVVLLNKFLPYIFDLRKVKNSA